MVAKATNEPHASPVKLKRSTSSKDVYEPWEMTERERELSTKYIKLIQGRIPSKEPILLSDVSPGEDTITDLSTSMMSSVISSSSQESVYARANDFLKQVTLLACLWVLLLVAVVHASLRHITSLFKKEQCHVWKFKNTHFIAEYSWYACIILLYIRYTLSKWDVDEDTELKLFEKSKLAAFNSTFALVAM